MVSAQSLAGRAQGAGLLMGTGAGQAILFAQHGCGPGRAVHKAWLPACCGHVKSSPLHFRAAPALGHCSQRACAFCLHTRFLTLDQYQRMKLVTQPRQAV